MIFSRFIGLGVWEILVMILGPSAAENDTKKLLDKRNLGKSIPVLLVLIISASMPVSSYFAYSQEVDRMGSTELPFFLSEALKEVPANSTILDQWSTCEPLKYFQIVCNVNPTIEILGADPVDWTKRIDERIARKNVFMPEIDDAILKKYSEIPALSMPGVGVLYKIYTGKPSFSAEDPLIQKPTNKSFDGKVMLLGYNLNRSNDKRSFTITCFGRA